MSEDILFPATSDSVRDDFTNASLAKPFDDFLRAFIECLSAKLLDTCRTEYPDLFTLGYWFRSSHILKIKAAFEARTTDFHVRPIGTVFQISPGNVDTLFLYSGLLALVMGNRVAIRVSSKQSEQLAFLLSLLNNLLDSGEHKEISKRLLIFRSNHDAPMIADLSGSCDLRIIWGGDQTIESIRLSGLSAKAKDISFPERISCSLLSAKAVLESDDMSQLIDNFAKDVSSFSQQACSSPKCVIWEGALETVALAKEKFWFLLAAYLENKTLSRSLADLVERQISLQKIALAAPIEITAEYGTICRADVAIKTLDLALLKLNQGHGLLLETHVTELSQLPYCLSERFQTLTYWGYSRASLLNLLINIEGRQLGFDRIEPIGNALNFNYIWDGYDLLHEFCKLIEK